MPAKSIHHLGVAVADLDEAVATYEHLYGVTVEDRDSSEEQGVIAALLVAGGDRIELLAPLADDTPVGRFLAKRGPGLHHVAYEVDDLATELDRLAADGVELIDAKPRRGLFGHDIAFIHPNGAHGVLSELVSHG